MTSTMERTQGITRSEQKWKSLAITLGVVALGTVGWALWAQSQTNSMMEMHAANLGPADREYDKRFIEKMIPHHQGAVEMAKDALNKAQHAEIKDMAKSIVQMQNEEIAVMESWKKRWY